MDKEARQKLEQLIKEKGAFKVLENKKVCEGFLKDRLRGHNKEINLLLSTFKAAESWTQYSGGIPKKDFAVQWIEQTADDHQLRKDAACWAVVSWGAALGKLSSQEAEEIERKYPPPPPPPPKPPDPVPTYNQHKPVPPPPVPDSGNTNVTLVLFLVVITGGLYIPVWFLQKRRVINKLNSGRKISAGVPVLALVLALTGLVLPLIAQEKMASIEMQGDVLTYLAATIAGVLILVLSTQVREIFIDDLNKRGKGISVSLPLTLFLDVVYLQYIIDRVNP